jgi:hypothetical protein
MKATLRVVALAAVAVLALGQTPASAREEIQGPQVYQQRLPDGSMVLSDRAVPGAQVQRTWQTWREDPATVQERQERRERMQREAQAVSERIQRSIEQREQAAARAENERLRFALSEAEREAERARAELYNGTAVWWPGTAWHSSFKPGHRPHVTPHMPRRAPRSVAGSVPRLEP